MKVEDILGNKDKFSTGAINDIYYNDEYVLKVFRYNTKKEVETQAKVLSWLKEFPCPRPIDIFDVNNRPALLMTKLPGKHLNNWDEKDVKQVGQALHKLNELMEGRTVPQRVLWNAKGIKRMIKDKEKIVREEMPQAEHLIDFVIDNLAKLKQGNFSNSFMHPDIKPENTLFEKGTLTGIVDWDDITMSPKIDGLAITAIWWCFPNGELDKNLFYSLINGYGENHDIIMERIRNIALFGVFNWCYKVKHDPETAIKHALKFKKIFLSQP